MKFTKDLLDSVTGIMKQSNEVANERAATVSEKMTNKMYSVRPNDTDTTAQMATDAREARDRFTNAVADVYKQSLQKEANDRQTRQEYMDRQYEKTAAKPVNEESEQLDELGPAAIPMAAGALAAAAAGTLGLKAADKMMAAKASKPKKKDVFTTKNGTNYKNGKAIGPVSDPDGGSAMKKEDAFTAEELEKLDEISKKLATDESTVTSVADVKAPIAKPKESGTVNKVEDERMKKQKVGLAKEAAEMDTPVETQGKHQCAIHVKHSQFGEGRTLTSQHAEPTNGLIEWYDVMFEHGIERVMTADVEVTVSESHMNHKKKK